MILHSIVDSIHGELPCIGQPCTIVRLSGCNLKCDYCDQDHSPQMTLAPYEVAKEIYTRRLNNVLLTGGEPLLQLDELCGLYNELSEHNWKGLVVVETNGTIEIPVMWKVVLATRFVMDFKKNAYNEELFWEKQVPVMDNRDVVKIVYSSVEDVIHFLGLLFGRIILYNSPTYVFSPEESIVPETYIHEKVKDILIKTQANHPVKLALQVQIHKILGLA